MKWNQITLKPIDGQEIIVREKDNNGKWCYAIGVWSDEHRFIMPWSTCDQCGGRCLFTASNRVLWGGGMNRYICEWLPLSQILELE